MKETARMNAMRSGVVVIGALAFGYLTLQLGFKPFLERAEAQQQALLHRSEPSSSQELSDTEFFFSDDSSPSDQNTLLLCSVFCGVLHLAVLRPETVCLVGEGELAPYILSIMNTSGEHKKWAMLNGRKRRKGNI
nr:hypothetical protein DM860_002429 [Ipomoea batatas]